MANPDIPEEAVEDACRLHFPWWDDNEAIEEDNGRSADEVRRDIVENGFLRRVIQAAAPALRQQGAEEAVEGFKRLAEQTSFEPGQPRPGGLPGEDADLADHVLEQFAQCGNDLRRLEAQRDQALKQGAEEERERLRRLMATEGAEAVEVALDQEDSP